MYTDDTAVRKESERRVQRSETSKHD